MTRDESIRERMFASIGLWLKSDLSQKEWCRQHEITYHIFHYWYRRYREQEPEPANDTPFVQLTMKQHLSNSCEIFFNDGTKIIFNQPVSAQFLKSLLF